MRIFPAAIPLTGKSIVFVGTGPLAEAKVRLFLSSPARLLWFCEGPAPSGFEIAQNLALLHRAPRAEDFRGAALVFLAENEPARREALRALAKGEGALVNAVDQPGESDFQTPALVDREEIVIAISTGGAAPVLAVDLRAAIEQLLPQRLEGLVRLARELRGTVKRVLKDFEARRRFWERSLRGPARDLALLGDEGGARKALLKSLNAPAPEAEGIVHLVGAGPGDPELLTLRAARLLREADVIVHDRLCGEPVLTLARRDARRIPVGKAKDHHPVPQETIEALLIAEARKGQRVVRLKGGDPFIFGRGGEEVAALRAAGIAVEVTPGISAALAAAASAQIPLTHRDHAQSLTLATAVARAGAAPAQLEEGLNPSTGDHTLAIYMGVAAAERLRSQLLASGHPPSLPLAIVENASREDERTLYGTLDALPDLVTQGSVKGPAMLFLGSVVALGRASPAPTRPLAAAALA